MGNLPENPAIVYDWVDSWGGAEQVLLELHNLFPTAPLYTSVVDINKALWAKVFPQIISTFMNTIPIVRHHHNLFGILNSLAFETLDLSQYDAVISVTSADAKSVITRPNCFHLCYCLTPTRYIYSHRDEYLLQVPKLLKSLALAAINLLKIHDQISSHRPDAYISISKTIQSRIKKYYQQESQIVYPPVNIQKYSLKSSIKDLGSKKHFVCLGRLVAYKNIDKVIKLFNKLNLPLVIIGKGPQEKKLKKIANSNIRFTGFISESEIKKYLSEAIGLISSHEEDFGIVYVEAQSAGVPIYALNIGGASEIIINKVTGMLVEDISDLEKYIKKYKDFNFSPIEITKNAEKFSQAQFQKNFAKVYKQLWTKHQNTFLS